MQLRILSLDDTDQVIQLKLFECLSSFMYIDTTDTIEGALQKLRNDRFDVLLLDRELGIGRKNGIDLLPLIRLEFPHLVIIMLTHSKNFTGIQDAFDRGVSDYIVKSSSAMAELQVRIHEAMKRIKTRQLVESRKFDSEIFDCPVVGVSTYAQKMGQFVNRFGKSGNQLLIKTSPGSGVRTIAHQLHQRRNAPYAPFLILNLRSMTQDQIEPALFGVIDTDPNGNVVSYEPGVLSLASGGDLLIEGLEFMPTRIQKRLCKAVETGRLSEDGSSFGMPISVRLIASFQTPSVKSKLAPFSLSEDLSKYFGGFILSIPDLMERPSDIAPIATHYLSSRYAATGLSISKNAIAFLAAQEWPGNFFQLAGCIDAAVRIHAAADPKEMAALGYRSLDVQDFERALLPAPPAQKNKLPSKFDIYTIDDIGPRAHEKCIDDAERTYFLKAIQICGGDLNKLILLSGLSRATLYKRLAHLGIQKPEIAKIRKSIIQQRRESSVHAEL